MTGLYDIHCHLLPGVDDGAGTRDESLKMMEMEYRQGVRHIFATPHFRRRMFEAREKEIKDRFLEARQDAQRIGSDLELHLGCEFYVDNQILENLEKRKSFFMDESEYALIEFDVDASERKIRDTVCDMLCYGWIPILAHVERYTSMIKNLSFLEEMSELGAGISVNAGSILGESGFGVKRFCKKLINGGFLDFVGSDAHGIHKRKPSLDQCASYLERKYGRECAREIMIENPKNLRRKAVGSSYEEE